MKYQFCFLSEKEAADGTKVGFAYANSIKNKWVEGNGLENYLTVGYVKGCDFVRYDNKSYKILKSFIDLDNNDILFICTEYNAGSETRTVFN